MELGRRAKEEKEEEEELQSVKSRYIFSVVYGIVYVWESSSLHTQIPETEQCTCLGPGICSCATTLCLRVLFNRRVCPFSKRSLVIVTGSLQSISPTLKGNKYTKPSQQINISLRQLAKGISIYF